MTLFTDIGDPLQTKSFRGCYTADLIDFARSLPEVLDAIHAATLLERQQCILIKPNLVNASPPPITLPVEAVDALIQYIRSCSGARIFIGEGTGEKHLETDEVFRIHGYDQLAARYDVELLDLNHAPLRKLSNPECNVFPDMFLPEVVLDSYLISFAVLKAHSLSDVTLSMKNLIGCAPPAHYQQGGHWKKSAFHKRMHESIFELNHYRKPDLALIDASIGMAEYHLGGPTCDPPVGKLIAGFDPVAVDAVGAGLLDYDWRQIPHIAQAHGRLGRAGQD